MTTRLREGPLTIAVVAATVGVIVFTILQYRWSRELIESTGVRMADTLQLSMVNWQIDFGRNFSEIATTLRPDAGFNETALAARLGEWRQLARYPDLVADARIVPVSGDGARGVPGTSQQMDAAHVTWTFDPDGPSLVFTLSRERHLVVSLDRQVLREQVMPDLAHRYFQGTDGLDYEVAVTSFTPVRRVVYSSDPGFGERDVADADGTLNVFGRSVRPGVAAPLSVFHRTSNRDEPVAAALNWFPLPPNTDEAEDWRLVVRHRRGGALGAFIADMHQRDLMISFGALGLLVLSIAMLIVTSSRAQRLAKLQMDFVTAVTHELRTPLAVISSAADNIAQGVVQAPEQVKQYGHVVGHQASRLSGLVEEILLFAATDTRPPVLALAPFDIHGLVSVVVAETGELIREGGVTVDTAIPDDLPQAVGDPAAVSQVLRNLISNALKYGADGRWLGISARAVQDASGRRVLISVTDRGKGIAPRDLDHVFEPFYRSAAATSAQIHGTGLGLTLALRLARAMRGDLTVTSEPGRGCTFTLALPAADPVPAPRDVFAGTVPVHR
jgi:signal transduction histidine kinase